MHRMNLPTALLAACLGLSGAVQAAEPCSDVAADLAAMTGADQALRKRINHLDIESPEQLRLTRQIMLVDRTNTVRLKALIAQCGWPDKARHGEKAADDAWLLAQHADQDLAFQKKVLELIEQAAARRGEGVDQSFAYLYDRVAAAEKRPQHYGTQLTNPADKPCELAFKPLDDRAKVEARRAQLKLGTLGDYLRMARQLRRCPVNSPAVMVDGVRHEPAKDYHYAPPAAERTPRS